MDLSTALTIYLIGVVLLVWICMLSDPSTDTIGTYPCPLVACVCCVHSA